MRSLETCTHVIPMPELCIYTPKFFTYHPEFWVQTPTPMLVVSMVSVLVP